MNAAEQRAQLRKLFTYAARGYEQSIREDGGDLRAMYHSDALAAIWIGQALQVIDEAKGQAWTDELNAARERAVAAREGKS